MNIKVIRGFKTDGYAACISALTVIQSSGSVPVLTFSPSQ